ncbi:flippase [Jidongwangia harbinensis]|uniref:flippase n=1 Tax=Jidongwangia harbinensis TaxID=2878561 RepID=UPI001CDA26BB|nr:flippase [Jidongwangia harbinensis]MCA2214359.1 flippase [Jidongwangia harbinensis]
MAERGDRQVTGIARGGTLNLAGAVLGQAAVFAVLLLLARWFDIRHVGRYAQCYAVLSLLGLLSLSGFRAGVTRFVAVHLADDDPAAVRGTVRLALLVSGGAATVLGGGLALAAPWLADRLHDPALTTGLRLMALTLPAMTICEAALAATRGWRSQRAFTLIGQVYEPVCRLVLTAVLLALGAGLTGAFWAIVVAGWTAAGWALLALRRRLRALAGERRTYRPRQLFSFSTVSWVSSLSSTGLIWLDTLLLGFYANPDIGVYNVATRLVTVAVFVLAPLNAAFGPYLAHLYHQDRMTEVRRSYAAVTGWVVRLSLPAFAVLLAFPDELLRLFGGAFVTGAAVTVILAAGQFVNAATGPCGTVLNMSGRVALNMWDNLAALVLNVLLNLWLIPAHGIVGAAVAWAVSLAVVNAARVLQVRRLIRALPVSAGMLKGLAAGAAALLAGLAVRALLPSGFGALAAGVAAIAVVYLGVVLGLGLSREDRMVLRALVRRRAGADRAEAVTAS